jgi:hypothetical protein
MPITTPHAHLYSSVDLEVAKAKLGHAGRKSSYAALNLVAYIDMMTMLVIFLLMSFSATGEILFVQKNIVLPDAQNWTDLERAPVIGVSKDVVTLDGSQVATADDLMKDSSTGDFKIAELHVHGRCGRLSERQLRRRPEDQGRRRPRRPLVPPVPSNRAAGSLQGAGRLCLDSFSTIPRS